jgi:hypothetical protein
MGSEPILAGQRQFVSNPVPEVKFMIANELETLVATSDNDECAMQTVRNALLLGKSAEIKLAGDTVTQQEIDELLKNGQNSQEHGCSITYNCATDFKRSKPA